MPPRIKDIAELVGLSPSTVSMVLNNRPGFSDETRSKVSEAAKLLRYHTVSAKRANPHTKANIPFVIYKKHGKVVAETPFFASLIEAIEREAKNNGFNLSIHYLNENEGFSQENLNNITALSERGILVLATEMDRADCAVIENFGVSYVLIDNTMLGVSADKVLISNCQGAYAAVEKLAACGHKRIGYIHSSVWISNFDEREMGYRLALREHGLEFRGEWVARVGSTHDTAYKDMLEYCDNAMGRMPGGTSGGMPGSMSGGTSGGMPGGMSGSMPGGVSGGMPTAFFADNDIIAMGAVKALTERNYRIPDDVSIIGFDDMPYCTMMSPNLSTMRVDTNSIGALAVRLLLEGNAFRQKIEVETKYIDRQSVKHMDAI